MKSGPPGPNLMGIGPMRFGPPFEIYYIKRFYQQTHMVWIPTGLIE